MLSQHRLVRSLKGFSRRCVGLPRPLVVRVLQRLRLLALGTAVAEGWAEVRDERHEEALPIDLQGACPGHVAILAFFLPQFHRDSINEQAWGKGFTEWRNATRARPLFQGHQQPKLPADLGFYDLTTPQAWADQQEITSRYGIHGFVLYHYWFSGVRPLEASLHTLLKHPEINLRFCLCWANESWTRRWDGGSEEVILQQDYEGDSAEELAEYLLPFMHDQRYVCDDGRPIYLVYRPDEISDPADFLGRLRAHLKQLGVDVCLGRVLSFRADPQDSLQQLFDFAVQFPVHGTHGQQNACLAGTPLRGISDPLQLTQTNVMHYQAWAQEQARCYGELLANSAGGVPVFPAVMPDFDNTARRGNRGGTLFVNHRDRAFCDWTKTALNLVRRINFVGQSRFCRTPYLFVTSWNEWAEGSMMEPSLQLGYHHLNELYRACVDTDVERSEILRASRVGYRQRHEQALVYHLYYPDLVDQATEILRDLSHRYDVFLSISNLIAAPHLRRLMAACSGSVVATEYPNCGYDLYPFFRYICDPELRLLDRYGWILKLHSKRSSHRSDGEQWSAALRQELSDVDLAALESRVGLIAPEMSMLRVADYLGSNSSELCSILQLLDLRQADLIDSNFPAGSMYLIRSACLQAFADQLPQLTAQLCQEGYRVDGSYAHAMERCIQLLVYRSGFYMRSSRGVSRISSAWAPAAGSAAPGSSSSQG